MADPVIERFRAIRCPAGSRPEIALETGEIGCFTPEGKAVPALAPEPAGLGVVGWAAVGSAVVALAAVALYWRR